MVDQNPQEKTTQAEGGLTVAGDGGPGAGDFVGRDQIQHGDRIGAGNITESLAAIGAGAQVIYQNIERALTTGEAAAKDELLERKRLAHALRQYTQSLEEEAGKAKEHGDRGRPYKALTAYEIRDLAFFYGRSAATRQIMRYLDQHRLTVLYAGSGAGKTSLLKAAIQPRLLAGGHVPVYLRPYSTPVHQALKGWLLPLIGYSENLAGASLHDFLRQTTALLGGKRLFVLLDQFEEFFSVQSQQDREAFLLEWAPCLDDDLLPVSWVIALRRESLGNVGYLDPPIRAPLANAILLRPLTREEAHDVVVEPARRHGIAYEAGLAGQIVEDLGGDEVSPPQLQLVCSALYESRDDTARISRRVYDDLETAPGILRDHLQKVIEKFPPEQRPLVRAVLYALVSSTHQMVLRSTPELRRDLAGQGMEVASLDQVLKRLVSNHLVRMEEREDLDPGASHAYELAHEYLLDKIEPDPAAFQRKVAQELLDFKVLYFQRDRIRLSKDELALILPYADSLSLSEEARTLIETSQREANRRVLRNFAGRIGLLVGIPLVLIALLILVLERATLPENLYLSLPFLFWSAVFLFGFIGFRRGWQKEVVVTAAASSGLLLITLLDGVSFWTELLAAIQPATSFWLHTSAFLLLLFFSYDFDPGERLRLRYQSFEEKLLGMLVGSVNGYLIIGSILFFVHDAGYPFQAIQPPVPGDAGGEAFLALIEVLPPELLAPPLIYFIAPIAVLIVIVAFI